MGAAARAVAPHGIELGEGDGGELKVRKLSSYLQPVWLCMYSPLLLVVCAPLERVQGHHGLCRQLGSFVRAGTVSMCEAARATVVWTELLLCCSACRAEHAAWIDARHSLLHLDWSQQLHTTMTALSDCAPKPSRRSRSYFLGHCCAARRSKFLDTFCTSYV